MGINGDSCWPFDNEFHWQQLDSQEIPSRVETSPFLNGSSASLSLVLWQSQHESRKRKRTGKRTTRTDIDFKSANQLLDFHFEFWDDHEKNIISAAAEESNFFCFAIASLSLESGRTLDKIVTSSLWQVSGMEGRGGGGARLRLSVSPTHCFRFEKLRFGLSFDGEIHTFLEGKKNQPHSHIVEATFCAIF